MSKQKMKKSKPLKKSSNEWTVTFINKQLHTEDYEPGYWHITNKKTSFVCYDEYEARKLQEVLNYHWE